MAKVRLDKSKKKPKPAAKAKPKPLTPEQREHRARIVRRVVNACALAVVVGGACIGYNALAAHVSQTYAVVDRPPAITLVNRPAWMSDAIAADVAGRLDDALPRQGSALDHDLLVRLGGLLDANAWVGRVNRVRRADVDGRDTVLIDCDYRTPLAIVEWNDGRERTYHLVAGDGALLPPTYDRADVKAIADGRDVATSLRVITGVAGPPPAAPGERWDAADLEAGLDVAALLNGRVAAQDVTVVDVSNYAQRRVRWKSGGDNKDAAQIVLRTKANTIVYWGRPPDSTDFLVEVSPQTKLENLRTVAEHFHGAPWPKWVDLRADRDAAVRYLEASEAGLNP